jgi:hypothetical protein
MVASLATLLVLVLTSWASSPNRRLPDPIPAAAPDTAFSSARAMAQLVEIAREPRTPGSPEHDRVRDHIVQRLRSYGLEPYVQTATSAVVDSARVRAATVRNVVARLPGSQSTGAVALMAHYDAAPLSPGASDGGAAVAAILEVARAVAASEALPNDVLVVFTDGGELGSLGARAFAESDRWSRDVAVAIEVDTRGSRGPSFTFSTDPDDGGLVEAFRTAQLSPSPTALARDLLDPTPAPTELSALLDRGVRGVRVVAVGGRAMRHQPGDRASEVDERTLQDVGRQLLLATRSLAQVDHRSGAARAPQSSYLVLPIAGVVSYPSRYSLLIGGGLLVVWLLVGVLLRRRRATRAGVLVGVGFGAAVVVASAGLSGSLLDIVSALHPEYGTLDTAFYRDGPYVLALVALVLAAVSAGFAVARRRFRTDEIILGALTVPLGFCLWVTLRHPTAAAAVQWPMMTTLLAAGVVALLGPRRSRSPGAWAGVTLLTAATLAVLMPSLELAAVAWTLQGAPRLGGVFAMTALMTLPLMDWLIRPRAWIPPAVALAVGASMVIVLAPEGPGTIEHPTPTTLVYLTDEEAPSRLPVTPESDARVDSTEARRVLGRWLTVPGPGERWTQSWVVDSPSGSRDPGVLLLPLEDQYEVAGTGPDAEIAPVTVRLLKSRMEGGRRHVQIGVTSGLLGEMVGLHVPEDARAELTTVGDVTWATTATPVRSLEHWGHPRTTELVVGARLEPEAEFLELVILEHHLRPREALGDFLFERPDSLVANTRTGSDRVIQRSLVRVSVADAETPSPK